MALPNNVSESIKEEKVEGKERIEKQLFCQMVFIAHTGV
jgi:hypothetical protein